VAEIIQTEDCYIWRETAPATPEGYRELLNLMYAELTGLEPNEWIIRVPPRIERIKDFDLNLMYYECRFRLAAVCGLSVPSWEE